MSSFLDFSINLKEMLPSGDLLIFMPIRGKIYGAKGG